MYATRDYACNGTDAVALLVPETARERRWIAEHCAAERWIGDAVAVESRRVPGILDAYTAERETD